MEANASLGGRRDSTLADWLIPMLLVCIGVAAYWNSFAGTFVFDDGYRIVGNPAIRQFWPLWHAMAGSPRPILELSLALNYAAGGLNTWGYHAVNLAVHICAGLVLFGIVRRMLESGILAPRFGSVSGALATAIAAIWLAHPLQTASVTYIIQRAESLMSLFYLLTLYCGIRACASVRPWRWSVAAIAACALGMGTKEVMVTAPLLMLLYDRTFVAGSFKAALRDRPLLYGGLAATWLLFIPLLANRAATEDEFHVAGLTPWTYALSQFGVIVHYLRLALWPHPLVLDYAWPLARDWLSIVPAAMLVLALLAGTLIALRKRTWAGFWGAWFFVILAPTSSVLPIADLAFEHRMYLALAAVVAVVVLGGYELLGTFGRRLGVSSGMPAAIGMGTFVVALAVLGYTTARRNEDYRSELAMWSDTVAKRPDNPRAHVNLGYYLNAQGRVPEAVTQYREAIRIKPDYAKAHNNLGSLLAAQGNLDEAARHHAEAVRLMPDYAEAHLNWGNLLFNQRNLAEAIVHLNEAVRLNPENARAHNNLGIALARHGRMDEAAAHFRSAVQLNPDFAMARENLRKAEAALGQQPVTRP